MGLKRQNREYVIINKIVMHGMKDGGVGFEDCGHDCSVNMGKHFEFAPIFSSKLNPIVN